MIASVVQAVLLALCMAGLYAAVAAGLTLTVGVTRIINFAHGEFVMLGAFLTYWLYLVSAFRPGSEWPSPA